MVCGPEAEHAGGPDEREHAVEGEAGLLDDAQSGAALELLDHFPEGEKGAAGADCAEKGLEGRAHAEGIHEDADGELRELHGSIGVINLGEKFEDVLDCLNH